LAGGDPNHESLAEAHRLGKSPEEVVDYLSETGEDFDIAAEATSFLQALELCYAYTSCPVCEVAFGRDDSGLGGIRGCTHFLFERLEGAQGEEGTCDDDLHPDDILPADMTCLCRLVQTAFELAIDLNRLRTVVRRAALEQSNESPGVLELAWTVRLLDQAAEDIEDCSPRQLARGVIEGVIARAGVLMSTCAGEGMGAMGGTAYWAEDAPAASRRCADLTAIAARVFDSAMQAMS